MMSENEYTFEDKEERRIFEPALWMQRRTLVGKYLKKEINVKSILDMGCGEGSLLGFLTGDTRIEKLTGIDILKERLQLASEFLTPTDTDLKFLRETPLTIDLYNGSICDPNLLNNTVFDVITCIEVLEHLRPDDLISFPDSIFKHYQAPLIIITTPNAEFNVHFPGIYNPNLPIDPQNPPVYRDDDHQFEWTRSEFEEWAKKCAETYGFTVEFDGVGQYFSNQGETCITANEGWCTQAAIFKKENLIVNIRENVNAEIVNDSLVAHIVYPSFDSSEITNQDIIELICEDIINWCTWNYRRTLGYDEDADDTVTETDIMIPCEKIWQTSWKLRQYCAGNYNKYINLISSGENEVEWWKINENSFVVIWEAIVERVPIPEEDDEVSYDSKDDNEEDENYACSHHDSGSPKRKWEFYDNANGEDSPDEVCKTDWNPDGLEDEEKWNDVEGKIKMWPQFREKYEGSASWS